MSWTVTHHPCSHADVLPDCKCGKMSTRHVVAVHDEKLTRRYVTMCMACAQLAEIASLTSGGGEPEAGSTE